MTDQPEWTAAERRIIATGSAIAIQVLDQMGAQGAETEDVWLVLALAARATERGVIEASRHAGDLKPYAAAQERLARLLALSDLTSDVVEAIQRRADGAPEPVQS
jgi:hypothetical protein